MNKDKEIEKERYNRRSEQLIGTNNRPFWEDPIASMPEYLRKPYLVWLEKIQEFANDDGEVLEIGSGAGIFTGYLLQFNFKSVIATDIAPASIEFMKNLFNNQKGFNAKIEDIECLSFKDESFDLVTACGVLSYGENGKVLEEIYRVLKPNGVFISVDSYSVNPFYRLNRWLHYLRGNRSKSTLLRMPRPLLVKAYQKKFNDSEVLYFGSFIFLVPLLKIILSDQKIAYLMDQLDKIKILRKFAFKVVMVFRK